MCDNAAAKAGQIVNDGLADTAGADDADGQVLHLHAAGRTGCAERVVCGVRAEHDVAGLADAHQHEHDRVVGNRIRRYPAWDTRMPRRSAAFRSTLS